MTISEKGLRIIKEFEEFRATMYRCPAGKPTIGYGHVITQADGHLMTARLTERQADALLRQDIANRFEPAVNKALGGHRPTQNQYDALMSLAFNIGTGAFGRSTLLDRVKAGGATPSAIRGWFGAWRKANGKVLPALVRRRKQEADLFLTA